jgi:hypothetical protein
MPVVVLKRKVSHVEVDVKNPNLGGCNTNFSTTIEIDSAISDSFSKVRRKERISRKRNLDCELPTVFVIPTQRAL